MLRWSLKNLLTEPLRLLISALAVALSFILVIFFDAVFAGESEQMVAYVEHMQADVWVMQPGVANMHMASSLLWDWKQDKVAEVPGVSEVAAILYLNAAVKAGGRDWFSYIIGLPADGRRSGPWDMAQGKPIPAPGEAVIPVVMAELANLQIGDTITLTDKRLHIVGLSHGTFSMSSAVVFVSRTDLGELIDAENQVSYIMVTAQAGVSAEVLSARIKDNVEKVNALSNAKFIDSDRQMAMQMGAEIIRMMTLIGTMLAIVIVAFTTYSQTARKQRELAIAKALGFRNHHLIGAALYQSIIVTLLGFLSALFIAYTLLPLLPTVVPQITLVLRPQALFALALIVVPVAILASLGPVLTVIRVDPLTVFQR